MRWMTLVVVVALVACKQDAPEGQSKLCTDTIEVLTKTRGGAPPGFDGAGARTPEQKVAALRAFYPRTPDAMAARLPSLSSLDTAGPELTRLAGDCEPLQKVVALIPMGAGLETVGPGVAEALEACDCKVPDLDGFLALFYWTLLPWPG